MASEKMPTFLQKEDTFRRTYEVRAGSVDADKRTVELSFSSEIEVERWWGIEVLGHGAGEVRMDRLKSGAALLVNHRSDDQVGVVEAALVDSEERKGRATVRFGKSSRAEEIFGDVRDGIRKLVSVGYRIHSAKEVEVRDGVPVYRITDWEPYEISIVSVPADPSVGVGRSTEIPQEEPPPRSVESGAIKIEPTRGQTMTIETEAARTVDVTAERKAGAEAESARAATILGMGEQYRAIDLATKFVREGKTVAEFQDALLKRFNEQSNKPLAEQMRAGEIGLSDKEVKRFSLMRAIRFLADPSNPDTRKAAAFELECSRAAQDQYGKDAKGVLVPADVLVRGFSTTTPASNTGANIVATELQAASFIELLRNKTWVLKYARKLAGLVGNVDIPKQTVANTAYWVGEGSAPTAGEMGTNKISLTPKTLAAFSDITRRLLIQSTPDAEALTRDDLIKTMALAIDYAAIYGSGSSNQPRGVKNYSGINAVDFAAANPTFAELVQMETLIASDNADVANMVYAANAAFRGYAKTTVKFSNTDGTIWEPGNTINGYPCEISNQIAAGDVFFGNWAELLVAMWSGLDLTVDTAALATSGGVRVIAFQDIDFQVRHVESFTYGVLVP
jgi:HK97 family phage major capsid protein/HK97 family phage prohead protease